MNYNHLKGCKSLEYDLTIHEIWYKFVLLVFVCYYEVPCHWNSSVLEVRLEFWDRILQIDMIHGYVQDAMDDVHGLFFFRGVLVVQLWYEATGTTAPSVTGGE